MSANGTAKAAKDGMVLFASGAVLFAFRCLEYYLTARQRVPSQPEASFGKRPFDKNAMSCLGLQQAHNSINIY